MWSRHRFTRLPAVAVCLIILGLLAGMGVALAADPGALPAENWNLRQLERLQTAGGGALTFAVLGDNRSNPAVFDQVLRRLDADASLAFAINVGDLVQKGTLEQFNNFFRHLRSGARLPFLTVPGNHDLGNDQDLTLFHKIFGPDYYAFQLQDHYFIVLNDNFITGLGEAQMAWLEDELKKSQACKTRLVFLHMPLFDPRGGRFHHALSPETGCQLAALLRQYRVTHIFAGHIHSYFSGHWEGVPYTITGGAGAPLNGTDPAHYFYHYLKVTLRGDQVEVQVERLSATGSN
jgi:3',5'-cyclic AMP phosphodiesterase CpdA